MMFFNPSSEAETIHAWKAGRDLEVCGEEKEKGHS